MKHFAHALVVGGSGMLSRFCRRLLSISDTVHVLARDEGRIRAIASNISPIPCDYRDRTALANALREIPAADLVVTWIHGRAPDVRRTFAKHLVPGGTLVQLLGSAHADPSHPERLSEAASCAETLPISHQAVVLGFMVEKNAARWLTDEEISDGVFASVETAQPFTIVGTVEPWSMRPGGGFSGPFAAQT